MRNAEKDRLKRQLLKRSLSKKEGEQLGKAILNDDELRKEIQFEVALREGMRQQHRKLLIDKITQDERSAGRQKKWKNVLIAAVVGVLLLVTAYVIFWSRTPELLPTEKKELMDNVIAAGIRDNHLGRIAATGVNWATLLSDGRDHPELIDEAYALLSREVGPDVDCNKLKENFYLAVIELYRNDEPEKAARHLACISNNSGPEFKAESQLPLIIISGLLGDQGALEAGYLATDFPFDTLPLSILPRVEVQRVGR